MKKTALKLLALLVVVGLLIWYLLPGGYSEVKFSRKGTFVKQGKSFPYTINIVYPKFSKVSAKINRQLEAFVNLKIKEFLAEASLEVAEMPSALFDAKFEDMEYLYELSYELYRQDNRVISLKLTEMVYYYGAAHPQHCSYSFSYLSGSGRKLSLADLFPKKKDYLENVAKLAIAELSKNLEINNNLDWIGQGAAAKPGNYRVFNLTKNDLVVTFGEYQVACYASGPQVVKLPFNKLPGFKLP